MGGSIFDSRRAARILAIAVAAIAGPAVHAADPAAALLAAVKSGGAHVDAAGRLQIDVHFECAIAAPVAALGGAGLIVTSAVKAGTLCIVEGWALPAALTPLAAVPGVTRISAPSYVPPTPPRALRPVARSLSRGAVQKQGSSQGTTGLTIDQYGVSIMRAAQYVAQTGVNGTGVTVGIQSNGIASLNLIQSRGELPSSIQVLYPAGDTAEPLADEGTALMEEVHAVAPGAKLVYCGPSTFVDYTSCLSQLITAGATIVLDDTGFPGDGLMSQNNDQSSAITQILAANPGVMMFTAAGNNDGTYWEGDYSPVSVATTALPTLSCPSGSGTPDAYVAAFGSANSETLTVTGGVAAFPLLLAWADPPGQITSQFDVYWFAAGATTPSGCFTTAGNTTDQLIDYLDLTAGVYTIVVASPDASAAGKFLKLWAGGDGLTTLSVSTSGGLISPQDMVSGVLTIGAVNGSDGIGDVIEPFSSSGPLTVQFPTAAALSAPLLVAPDGISVDATGTYFASDLFPDGNFYGTSASVANAAAVGALLQSAFPSLSVAQLSTALESGATALSPVVPNDFYGYGRVDALGALSTLPAPTISTLTDQTSTGSASTTAQAFTLTGSGTLTITVSSSNTALVPSALVTAGAAGVTISSGCGTSTLACTFSVTPVAGQSGTATVTISAADGAHRATTTQLTITASQPAVTTSSSSGTTTTGTSTGTTTTGTSTGTTTTGSGSTTTTATTPAATSGGGGGMLQLWTLLCLGALVGWSQQRRAAGFRL